MGRYKCVSHHGGYERVLNVGQIYQGVEEPGIFATDPYLVVYDDEGNKIAAAHLSRFEKVEE